MMKSGTKISFGSPLYFTNSIIIGGFLGNMIEEDYDKLYKIVEQERYRYSSLQRLRGPEYSGKAS